jgi:hypothetical protein
MTMGRGKKVVFERCELGTDRQTEAVFPTFRIGKTGTDVVECAFDRRRMDGVPLAHLVGIRGARAEPETAIASNPQQRMYYA